MGDLEDHYLRQQADAQAAVPPFHVAYNMLVEIWGELQALMLKGVRKNPPARCEWMQLGGARLVCWQIYTDYEVTDFLYFMSDGSVVRTEQNMSKPARLDIRKVPASTTSKQAVRSGRANIGILKVLCMQALTIGGNYNSSIPGHSKWRAWHGAIESVDPGRYPDW